jgi:hypothetical protein
VVSSAYSSTRLSLYGLRFHGGDFTAIDPI